MSEHILKREKTGEIIRIGNRAFKVGRSEATDDYVITDNRSVSRGHATFYVKEDVCYITDNGSLNKSFVNGSQLTPYTEYALNDGDGIRLYNERFIYFKQET